MSQEDENAKKTKKHAEEPAEDLLFDEKTLKSFESILAPLFIKSLSEIQKETYKYKEEEKNILKIKETIEKTEELLFRNILGIRNLLLTITTLSFVIAGAIISASVNLSNSRDNIFNINIVYWGLSLLAMCILLSILYLTLIYDKENLSLSETKNVQKQLFGSYFSLLNSHVKTNKNFLEYWKEKEKLNDRNEQIEKDANEKIDKMLEILKYTRYIPWVISILFLSGIAIISIAFFIK